MYQARTPHGCDFVGENDLQITYRCFFEVITTCIGFEMRTSFFRHANNVASLMQQGMNWRVVANVYRASNNASLTVPPETSRNWLVVGLHLQLQVVFDQQGFERSQGNFGNNDYFFG